MPRQVPSPHLTTATNRAVERALRPGHGEGDGDLRDVVRDLCTEARRQGTRAEELIVLFKRTWSEHPELQTMSPEETGRRLDQIVTMCIKEYYDGPR
jgi:hypothetical protein